MHLGMVFSPACYSGTGWVSGGSSWSRGSAVCCGLACLGFVHSSYRVRMETREVSRASRSLRIFGVLNLQ